MYLLHAHTAYVHIHIRTRGVNQAIAEQAPRGHPPTRHNTPGNQTHGKTLKENLQVKHCNKSKREQRTLADKTAHWFTAISRVRKQNTVGHCSSPPFQNLKRQVKVIKAFFWKKRKAMEIKPGGTISEDHGNYRRSSRHPAP